METLDDLIMAIAVFGSAILITFILAKYNYLIKKVIAENGGNTGVEKSRFSLMDVACIVISLGVGLGISSIITVLNLSEDTMDLIIYSIISICGGLGLMAAHYLRKKS